MIGNIVMVRMMREVGLGIAVSIATMAQFVLVNLVAFVIFQERPAPLQFVGIGARRRSAWRLILMPSGRALGFLYREEGGEMDEDLPAMSREALVAEVKRLTRASASTAIPAGTNCAGTIRSSGAVAGTDPDQHRRAAVAEISARLRQVSRVAGPRASMRAGP